MNLDKAIKELEDENEQCYYQCEGHCSEIQNNICTCRDSIILSSLQQYRAIGTVEECREAREGQRGKKPVLDTIYHYQYYCPNCEDFLARKNGNKPHHCICGQAIDWSDAP